MCLDTITRTADDMPDACIAYKSVRKQIEGGKLMGYFPHIMSITRKGLGTTDSPSMSWGMPEERGAIPIRFFPYTNYRAGVHAYLDKEHAIQKAIQPVTIEKWFDQPKTYNIMACVMVLLRGPICEGREDTQTVVVYKECTILDEIPLIHWRRYYED